MRFPYSYVDKLKIPRTCEATIVTKRWQKLSSINHIIWNTSLYVKKDMFALTRDPNAMRSCSHFRKISYYFKDSYFGGLWWINFQHFWKHIFQIRYSTSRHLRIFGVLVEKENYIKNILRCCHTGRIYVTRLFSPFLNVRDSIMTEWLI